MGFTYCIFVILRACPIRSTTISLIFLTFTTHHTLPTQYHCTLDKVLWAPERHVCRCLVKCMKTCTRRVRSLCDGVQQSVCLTEECIIIMHFEGFFSEHIKRRHVWIYCRDRSVVKIENSMYISVESWCYLPRKSWCALMVVLQVVLLMDLIGSFLRGVSGRFCYVYMEERICVLHGCGKDTTTQQRSTWRNRHDLNAIYTNTTKACTYIICRSKAHTLWQTVCTWCTNEHLCSTDYMHCMEMTICAVAVCTRRKELLEFSLKYAQTNFVILIRYSSGYLILDLSSCAAGKIYLVIKKRTILK